MGDSVREYEAGFPASRSASELNDQLPCDATTSEVLCSRERLVVSLSVCLLLALNHCIEFLRWDAVFSTSLAGEPPPKTSDLMDVVPSGRFEATRTVPVG